MGENSLGFGRSELLAAFDRLAECAITNDVRLDIAVYGGSALMLASNFRFSTEDVDIGPIPKPWPSWLAESVKDIATDMGFSGDWLNDAVEFHLSSLADIPSDHVEFGTFPRGGTATGLSVFVPKPEYMLAMKLKAMRINDPVKGKQETSDILNLMQVLNVADIDEAIDILGRYYPKSAQDTGKHRFLLKHMLKNTEKSNAPEYPIRSM